MVKEVEYSIHIDHLSKGEVGGAKVSFCFYTKSGTFSHFFAGRVIGHNYKAVLYGPSDADFVGIVSDGICAYKVYRGDRLMDAGRVEQTLESTAEWAQTFKHRIELAHEDRRQMLVWRRVATAYAGLAIATAVVLVFTAAVCLTT